MTFSRFDHECMALALRLAARGLYTTDPNPRVGCVIAMGQAVLGQGWHAYAGQPHAEVNALQNASGEVRGAVIYASLIVIAVLAPLMAMGGIAGRIFSPLARAYALAVAASLVVALVVTPALCALVLPRLGERRIEDGLLTRGLRRGYDSVLRVTSRAPGLILVGALLLGAAAAVAVPLLGGGFLPEFRENVVIAEVSTRPGTSLAETTRLASRITSALRRPGGWRR